MSELFPQMQVYTQDKAHWVSVHPEVPVFAGKMKMESRMEQLKIAIIRHGKPSSVSNDVVDALGFEKWVQAYDLSDVDTRSLPPLELQLELEKSYSISSDLNRALHSARLCANKNADCILKELREFEIPCFRW